MNKIAFKYQGKKYTSFTVEEKIGNVDVSIPSMKPKPPTDLKGAKMTVLQKDIISITPIVKSE